MILHSGFLPNPLGKGGWKKSRALCFCIVCTGNWNNPCFAFNNLLMMDNPMTKTHRNDHLFRLFFFKSVSPHVAPCFIPGSWKLHKNVELCGTKQNKTNKTRSILWSGTYSIILRVFSNLLLKGLCRHPSLKATYGTDLFIYFSHFVDIWRLTLTKQTPTL